MTQVFRKAASNLGRGGNQSGLRLYNERLVLSLVRRYGSLPKADIARLTGLSPTTAMTIVRRLEADSLLLKNAPQRGRVGQPSVPLSLNPSGAFSLGAKVGRRSADLVLIDFTGGVRHELHQRYDYPVPQAIVEFITAGSRALGRRLTVEERSRIAGLGIASPFELWNWEEEVGSPAGAMEAWRGFDLRAEVGKAFKFPVYLCNDASAACAAELLFGKAAHHHDLLYVFIAWFVGGGVVLNGNLFLGRSGYAGALGPMLVSGDRDGTSSAQSLLGHASLYILDRRVREAGGDSRLLWDRHNDWSAFESAVGPWIEETAAGLARAIISAMAVVDFQATVIDGALPATIRTRFVERVVDELDKMDRKGLAPFSVEEGSIGNNARAIGGASLPFLAQFMRDRELLFVEAAGDSNGQEASSARRSAF
jgi:predicted NBD/HSP70 family sugar kinase